MNRQFPPLTGIRAVAALMVFFLHQPLRLQPEALARLQLSFYSGVTLFFVLSGFLITYRHYEETALTPGWLYNYFLGRIARIIPVYFLVLTAVVLLRRNADPVYLLQNYTLTHTISFLFPTHGIAILPSWSLAIEACFYVLAPFIFLLCRKYTLWVPFAITGLILLLQLHWRPLPTHAGTFFGHCVEFFSGIWLALLVLREEKTTTGAPGRTIAGIIGIIGVLLLLTYATNKAEPLKRALIITGNNLLLPFPVILLYYGLIREKTWVARFLSRRTLLLAGRISYAFYLIHQPVIDYIGPHVFPYFGDRHYNLYVLTILSLAAILSLGIFFLYEKPMNDLIRKRTIRQIIVS